jgi:hypothetical protein
MLLIDRKYFVYRKRFKVYKTIFLFVSKLTNRSLLREDRTSLKLQGLTLKKLDNFTTAMLLNYYGLLCPAARSITGYSFIAVSTKKRTIEFITNIFNMEYSGLRPYFAITNKTILKISRSLVTPKLLKINHFIFFIFLINSVIKFLYFRLNLTTIL